MSVEKNVKIKTEGRAATLEDIARALGLTKTTVSYALNGKGRMTEQTRAAVHEMARDMGFRPNPHARGLTVGRARDTVGLFSHNLDLGVTTRKLQLIQRSLARRGYRAPMYISGGQFDEDEEAIQIEAINTLRLQRTVGILCNTVTLLPNALIELERYQDEGGILVCYDNPTQLNCDQVVFDRDHNAYITSRYLLELGHRRIAFYDGWFHSGPDRLEGHQRALAEFGVPADPDLLLYGAHTGARHEFEGGCSEENGYLLADVFLKLDPRPTAVSILNDSVASAFVAGLLKQGVRVPEDVSVVGHDNLPMAAYVSAVPLTTASQPLEEIASQATNLLLDRIEGKYDGPPRRTTITGELIIRQSTAAI